MNVELRLLALRPTIYLCLLIALVVMLAACRRASSPPAVDETGPIKVGAIFDLTGPTSSVSTRFGEGAKGFVAWKNSQGGVNGRPVLLISQDYAYRVDLAEQLYSLYVHQDEVVMFLGWGTGDTEALRGKIGEDKIPFVSASYSINLADPEKAPYNFLVGTSYSDQMVIALQWILEQGDSRKIAVLHQDSPFGKSPVSDGMEFAQAHGLEIITVAMSSDTTDLTPELSQTQSFGADYIIIQNVSSPAALAMRNAKNLGITAQFLCLNWCADEIVVDLAGPAAEGLIGAMPFTPPSVDVPGDDHIRQFLAQQGQNLNELGVRYSQGWWSLEVLMTGAEAVLDQGQPLTGEAIHDALENLKNFDTGGITAPLSFSETDHRGNTALRLFQVQDGQWQPISGYIESNIALE